mmetsp:Transcript_60616/g.126921  ORF Transcript_60616/g.126921 Transcript_60616/m.126921 type:complete len:609 (-) Transcript_60616:746-2572(-)
MRVRACRVYGGYRRSHRRTQDALHRQPESWPGCARRRDAHHCPPMAGVADEGVVGRGHGRGPGHLERRVEGRDRLVPRHRRVARAAPEDVRRAERSEVAVGELGRAHVVGDEAALPVGRLDAARVRRVAPAAHSQPPPYVEVIRGVGPGREGDLRRPDRAGRCREAFAQPARLLPAEGAGTPEAAGQRHGARRGAGVVVEAEVRQVELGRKVVAHPVEFGCGEGAVVDHHLGEVHRRVVGARQRLRVHQPQPQVVKRHRRRSRDRHRRRDAARARCSRAAVVQAVDVAAELVAARHERHDPPLGARVLQRPPAPPLVRARAPRPELPTGRVAPAGSAALRPAAAVPVVVSHPSVVGGERAQLTRRRRRAVRRPEPGGDDVEGRDRRLRIRHRASGQAGQVELSSDAEEDRRPCRHRRGRREARHRQLRVRAQSAARCEGRHRHVRWHARCVARDRAKAYLDRAGRDFVGRGEAVGARLVVSANGPPASADGDGGGCGGGNGGGQLPDEEVACNRAAAAGLGHLGLSVLGNAVDDDAAALVRPRDGAGSRRGGGRSCLENDGIDKRVARLRRQSSGVEKALRLRLEEAEARLGASGDEVDDAHRVGVGL